MVRSLNCRRTEGSGLTADLRSMRKSSPGGRFREKKTFGAVINREIRMRNGPGLGGRRFGEGGFSKSGQHWNGTRSLYIILRRSNWGEDAESKGEKEELRAVAHGRFKPSRGATKREKRG